MKLSRIIPESPRHRSPVTEPVKVKSQVQMRAQAFENEKALSEAPNITEDVAATAKGNDLGVIEDVVSIRAEAKDRNFAESKKVDFDTPASKSSGYKNPIQKVKADKIEEMAKRFFMSAPSVKTPSEDTQTEVLETLEKTPTEIATPRETLQSLREESQIPLET